MNVNEEVKTPKINGKLIGLAVVAVLVYMAIIRPVASYFQEKKEAKREAAIAYFRNAVAEQIAAQDQQNAAIQYQQIMAMQRQANKDAANKAFFQGAKTANGGRSIKIIDANGNDREIVIESKGW